MRPNFIKSLNVRTVAKNIFGLCSADCASLNSAKISETFRAYTKDQKQTHLKIAAEKYAAKTLACRDALETRALLMRSTRVARSHTANKRRAVIKTENKRQQSKKKCARALDDHHRHCRLDLQATLGRRSSNNLAAAFRSCSSRAITKCADDVGEATASYTPRRARSPPGFAYARARR